MRRKRIGEERERRGGQRNADEEGRAGQGRAGQCRAYKVEVFNLLHHLTQAFLEFQALQEFLLGTKGCPDLRRNDDSGIHVTPLNGGK